MELLHEILDTIDIDNDNDAMEVLKQAVKEENVVLQSEATEENMETEIEEIIEIIEEIEEDKEEPMQTDVIMINNENTDVQDDENTDIQDDENDKSIEILSNEEFNKDSEIKVYAFDENSSGFKTNSEKEKEKKDQSYKNNKKQVITYDVDEDWQDEDMEDEGEFEQSSDILNHCTESVLRQKGEDKKCTNNQVISFPLQINRTKSNDNIGSMAKPEKSKSNQDYKCNVNNVENVDNNASHEIVKNVENNLLYTVLGTKKHSSVKALQTDKLSDAQYIKVLYSSVILIIIITVCKN